MASFLGTPNEFSVESSSINPAMRKALVHMMCYQRLSKDAIERDIEQFTKYTEILNQVGSGSYPNEGFYWLENWREAFWGTEERYQRLQRVKQKWDPELILSCHHCVGYKTH